MGGRRVPAVRAGTIRCGHGLLALCAFSLFHLGPVGASDEALTSQAASAPAPETPLHTLAAGTEIHLRLLEPVGSHTHKRGDRFKLEVAQAIAVGDFIVVAAGSPAIGEVIHAAKSGMSGKAGELILVARSLSAGEHVVKLRSFTAGNGENRFALATGLGVTLGIPALFVVGKNLVLPAGTDVYAKVTADTPLPSVMEMGTAELPQPAIAESSTEIDNNESNQD